jgi:UDP-N-acetylmuramate dehydrogenase
MIQIRRNVSLKNYNTFGIDVKANYFVEVFSEEDIFSIVKNAELNSLPVLILGGGSNILFFKNFDGIVLKNNLRGISVEKETDERIWVSVGAGEVWHTFVMWCVEKNYGGVENLSLIPGFVGAAPIQNIGAYGVELKNIFHSLEAIHFKTGEKKIFTLDDCNFGYRDSVFKNSAKGQFIITTVNFILNKQPVFNTTYGAIEQELKKSGIKKISVKAISDAVIHIRQSKLPDPVKLGNAGSFFKNPEVSLQKLEELKLNFPTVPSYVVSTNSVKLAAGWLIEQCGWKGKVVGNTGSHKDQALVLVNYGNATGEEIYSLAMQIKKSVYEKFGVAIEPEVNVV